MATVSAVRRDSVCDQYAPVRSPRQVKAALLDRSPPCRPSRRPSGRAAQLRAALDRLAATYNASASAANVLPTYQRSALVRPDRDGDAGIVGQRADQIDYGWRGATAPAAMSGHRRRYARLVIEGGARYTLGSPSPAE